MGRRIPDQFVPLDVNYARDPAIRAAGHDAELLFIRSLAHAKSARTDGELTQFDVEIIGIGLRRVQERVTCLVRERLWEITPSGYRIRSWAKWNATREEQRAARLRRVLGALKSNHNQGRHTDDPHPDCPLCEADTTPAAPASGR